MDIVKYNRGNTGYTIGSAASIAANNKSTTTTTPSNSSVDCQLWGNDFDGVKDLEETLFVNGSLYAMPKMFENEDEEDEEEELPEGTLPEKVKKEFEKEEDDEGGNIYAQNLIRSNEVYGKTVYLDYPERTEDDEDGNRTWDNKTDLLEIFKMLLPVGSIIMHNGSVTKDKLLEYGWAVCDGSNGTPNLTGKFIKGGTTAGGTGGNATHTLTTQEMPSHNHSATSTSTSNTTVYLNLSQGSSSVPFNLQNKYIPALDMIQEEYYDTGGSSNAIMYTGNKKGDYGLTGIKVNDLVGYAGGATGSATATTTTNTTTTIGNTGGGQAFNIEPPYYTLIYIMRIK